MCLLVSNVILTTQRPRCFSAYHWIERFLCLPFCYCRIPAYLRVVVFSCLLHGWYIVIILLKYMAHTLLLAKDMSRYKGASIKDVQGRGEGGVQPLPPTRIKIKNHQTSITKS